MTKVSHKNVLAYFSDLCCVMIYTALAQVTSTEVAELVVNFWSTRVTESIDRHPAHASRHLGLQHLTFERSSPSPETKHHKHLPYHKFVCHLGLGDPAPACTADLEAEVVRNCVRHVPIRRMSITRGSTRELWFMLRVSRQSCGNGECSWS